MFCRQLSHRGIWPKQKEGEQLVHSDLAQTSSIKKKRAAGPPDLAQIASKTKGRYLLAPKRYAAYFKFGTPF